MADRTAELLTELGFIDRREARRARGGREARRPGVRDQPRRAPPLRHLRPQDRAKRPRRCGTARPRARRIDPYGAEIENGKLYRPPSAVSYASGCATYTFALVALASAPALPGMRGAVEQHFTYDEEFGGELGPGWLLHRTPRAAAPAELPPAIQLPGRHRTQRLPADEEVTSARSGLARGLPGHLPSTRHAGRHHELLTAHPTPTTTC